MIQRSAFRLLTLTVVVLGSAVPAFAESSAVPEAAAAAQPAKVRVVGPNGAVIEPAEPTSEVERYCMSIADPALDARNALQMAKLKDAEGQLSVKIDELEAKRAEVETWLAERKAFIESTSDIMLDIYAAMKPDAAAAQLAGLDRPTAAALLSRLKARQAGAILAEMPAPVAAELGNLIAQKTDRTALGETQATERRL